MMDSLPCEIILLIGEHSETLDLTHLAATSRRLCSCTRGILIKRALTHQVCRGSVHLTVLQWCVLEIRDRRSMFLDLLEQGANFSVRYTNGLSLLHLIASQGDAYAAKRLTDAGSNPAELIDREGNTPLVYASLRGHLDVVNVFVKSATFAATQTSKALCVASKRGYLEIVKVLCEYGADVSYWDWFDRGPAIWCAASEGNQEIVQTLMGFGADPCSRGLKSRTVLHEAVCSGHVPLVQTLVALPKSSLNEVDDDGLTPLQLAIKLDKPNIAAILIGTGSL